MPRKQMIIGKRPFTVETKRGPANAIWNQLHLDARPKGRGRFAVSAKDERTIDGHVFDSKTEMLRVHHLRMLQRAGKISALELQPKWDVKINGQHFCTYTADASYFCHERNRPVIEEVKSHGTRLDKAYRLRRKAAELAHGIRIEEVVL